MRKRKTVPRWGVSGHATLSSTTRTTRPFDQNRRPPQQPKRQSPNELRLGRPKHEPFVKEPRSLQRVPQHARLTRAQRQPREYSQPPPPQIKEHVMAPRRSLRLSQLASEKQTRPYMPSLKVSLGLSRQYHAIRLSNASQPQEELSSARRHELMSGMTKSIQDVMDSMLSGGPTDLQWKFRLRKKNVVYYSDETNVKPGQTRFCCVSHTHATVDEIMGLFLPTDEDAVLRNNKLLHDNVMKAKVLLTLRPPTKKRPMNSMYVRYSSFRTSGPLPNQEMYAVVATDMLRQSDGSTIGYCLWDSIDDHDNLMTVKTTGLEFFTSFRSGFFFRHPGRTESASGDPMQGHTKIVYMVGIEGDSRASGLTSRLVMEKHGSVVDHLCSHFRQNHLDPSTFVMKTQWKSKYAAKSCKQCDKPFQLLSSRVNCHACGHVVCRPCVSKESVKLHTSDLVSTHMCFACLEKAGLPAPDSAQKTRSRLRQSRLRSETASKFHPLIVVVSADMTDTGEWAIPALGGHVRARQKAAFV